MKNYHAMTVSDLKNQCAEIEKKGFGNRKILISTDDEGNGYHGLFYTFITDPETIRAFDNDGLIYDDVDTEDIVLLG